jgi:hypothetical protein
MAALAGGEGVIALLMALAVQQTPVPADLPALVTAGVADCVAAQIDPETAPDVRPAAVLREEEARDGSQVQARVERGYCQIRGRWWRGDGEVMARAVQAGLAAHPKPLVVDKWREQMASEWGLSVWTTFERKDVEGRTIVIVRLIEPADGAMGEVDIAWETPPR